MPIKLIENLVSQDKDPIANLSLLDTITQDLKTAMISKEVVARDSIRKTGHGYGSVGDQKI